MAFDPGVVLRRDKYRCRLRFHGCEGAATTTVLHAPRWLGGEATLANARASCIACMKQQREQRKWAESLFEGAQR